MCHTIIGPSRVGHHLSEGRRDAAIRHTEMAGEPAALQASVSYAVVSALGHSSNDTFRVEVVGELVADFQKLEERRSRLERLGVRILQPAPWATTRSGSIGRSSG
jgi:hypothetical protein